VADSTKSGRSSTGLDEHLAAAMSYVLGFITGLIFLAIEKDSAFVRFHARQSVLTFLGVLIVDVLLLTLPFFSGVVVPMFTACVVVLWAWLIVKAALGARYKLPYVGDLADRMNG
jgi:uncharacterized membrane protein